MMVGMKGSKQTTSVDMLLWLFLTLDTLLGTVEVCEKSFFTAFNASREFIKSLIQAAHSHSRKQK